MDSLQGQGTLLLPARPPKPIPALGSVIQAASGPISQRLPMRQIHSLTRESLKSTPMDTHFVQVRVKIFDTHANGKATHVLLASLASL